MRYVKPTYVSWDQNPEYIEACRTIPSRGDPVAYGPTHVSGTSHSDTTTFKVGLASWEENNLPDIMYQLWPCRAWKDFSKSGKPDQRKDARGNPMFERYPRPNLHPRPILDFPILRGIDQISTEVSWWLLEILFRLDPRLTWDDIDMLMEFTGKRMTQPVQRKFTNAPNNVCSRWRQDFFMISWRERSKANKPNRARDNVLNALNRTQKRLNTTRGSTPGPDRLGNRVPLPTGKRRYNIKASGPRKQNTPWSAVQLNQPSARAYQPASQLHPPVQPQHPFLNPQVAIAGPNQSDALDVVGESQGDHEAELIDGDDNTWVVPGPTQTSGLKRKQSAIDPYAGIEQSEDAASPEYGQTPYQDPLQNDHQGQYRNGMGLDSPPLMDPVIGRTQQIPLFEVHVNKKGKTGNSTTLKLPVWDSRVQQSLLRNASHNNNSQLRPKYLREVRKHRSQRVPPCATSSTIPNLPLHPYAPQERYEDQNFPSQVDQNLLIPTQAAFENNPEFNADSEGGFDFASPPFNAYGGLPNLQMANEVPKFISEMGQPTQPISPSAVIAPPLEDTMPAKPIQDSYGQTTPFELVRLPNLPQGRTGMPGHSNNGALMAEQTCPYTGTTLLNQYSYQRPLDTTPGGQLATAPFDDGLLIGETPLTYPTASRQPSIHADSRSPSGLSRPAPMPHMDQSSSNPSRQASSRATSPASFTANPQPECGSAPSAPSPRGSQASLYGGPSESSPTGDNEPEINLSSPADDETNFEGSSVSPARSPQEYQAPSDGGPSGAGPPGDLASQQYSPAPAHDDVLPDDVLLKRVNEAAAMSIYGGMGAEAAEVAAWIPEWVDWPDADD